MPRRVQEHVDSLFLRLKHRGTCGQYHNQTTQYKNPRYNRHKHNTPSASWELASNNIMLRLEIPVKSNEEHQDAYPNKCCAKRLSQVPESVKIVGISVV